MEEMTGNQFLQEAALKGDVTLLADLVGKDPLLLHRPSKVRPLHIASRLGHLGLTEELLRLNPSLAEELDPTDKSSPLHLASGHGHVDVVKALVLTNPGVCLARDLHGRNPAHVASVKGHVLVLEELIRAVPAAARERVGGGGESILHLCVKCNQLEALRAVMATTQAGDAGMLLNAKDGDGNTILHIAMANQRLEIINLLLDDNRVIKNMQNEYGLTAMDIFMENNKNVNPQLHISLRQAKLLSSNEMNKEKEKERQTTWFHNQRSALMVVASLVATMAFQAGLTPPFMYEKDNPPYSIHYNEFVVANTIGLVSSMSSLILLISGLPGRLVFMVVVTVMMWMAISCMTFTYGFSLLASTNSFANAYHHHPYISNVRDEFRRVFVITIFVWVCVTALILVGHLTTWTVKFYQKFGWLIKKIRMC